MTMQKVAWPSTMVHVENGMSITSKADRSDMPVMIPGKAMGNRISSEIWSRPKKRARLIAAATSVPSTSASRVEIAATFSDRYSGGQMSGRFHATANHFSVSPGGGN